MTDSIYFGNFNLFEMFYWGVAMNLYSEMLAKIARNLSEVPAISADVLTGPLAHHW